MSRNWDVEWQELTPAEDKAFQELRKSMTVVTGMFLGKDGPSEEQLDRAQNAQKAWDESERQIEAWPEEWRSAHRRGP